VVKENATPQYFKPRLLPYAIGDKVAAELNRLEKAGVLKKVESSDWATPIVPVLKPDGTVSICGDFKLTFKPIPRCSKVPNAHTGRAVYQAQWG